MHASEERTNMISIREKKRTIHRSKKPQHAWVSFRRFPESSWDETCQTISTEVSMQLRITRQLCPRIHPIMSYHIINVNDVNRVELRVAHDSPRIPLPTLSVHALTRSEVSRKVEVYDTERVDWYWLPTRIARLSPVSDTYSRLRIA
jgi:hypothetical protein